MFVFFLEIIVAFFFCKAFMIFVRGGRPGGIFEKSEEDEGEKFFSFFCFFWIFFSLGLFLLSHQIVVVWRIIVSGQTFKNTRWSFLSSDFNNEEEEEENDERRR